MEALRGPNTDLPGFRPAVGRVRALQTERRARRRDLGSPAGPGARQLPRARQGAPPDPTAAPTPCLQGQRPAGSLAARQSGWLLALVEPRQHTGASMGLNPRDGAPRGLRHPGGRAAFHREGSSPPGMPSVGAQGLAAPGDGRDAGGRAPHLALSDPDRARQALPRTLGAHADRDTTRPDAYIDCL